MDYHPYLPVLIILAVGATLSGIILFLSSLVGPKKTNASKMSPYECGLEPIGTARERVDVRFSLVAMLFILFDIEAVFLFPWAILYRQFIEQGLGIFIFIEMGLFIVILTLGLFYVWRKGALDWR